MDLPKLFEEIKQLKPVHQQIKNGKYPIGEIFEDLPGKDDTNAINRMTSAEKKELDASFEDMYKDLRRAAESHRQTRKYIKSWLKPGMKMFDIW
jgi:methionyl aminopeptidase